MAGFLCGPLKQQFLSHLQLDADSIAKIAIKLFDGVTGSSRVKVAHFLCVLFDCFGVDQIATKRLGKLHEKTQPFPHLLHNPSPSSKSLIPAPMIPLAILSSFLLKYHSKDRILGLFEAMQLVVRRMDRQILKV